MDFEEALDKTIEKRKYLILREIARNKSDDEDGNVSPNNVNTCEIQQKLTTNTQHTIQTDKLINNFQTSPISSNNCFFE